MFGSDGDDVGDVLVGLLGDCGPAGAVSVLVAVLASSVPESQCSGDRPHGHFISNIVVVSRYDLIVHHEETIWVSFLMKYDGLCFRDFYDWDTHRVGVSVELG